MQNIQTLLSGEIVQKLGIWQSCNISESSMTEKPDPSTFTAASADHNSAATASTDPHSRMSTRRADEMR